MNNEYVILLNGGFASPDELYHHGIKGQKWGIRRYQNEDGSLTAAGKKRMANRVASNREAVIVKGSTLYRVSDSNKSDTSSDKIYVSADSKTGDFYMTKLGKDKIYKTGKAYVHQYLATTDLKMPDKKTMEKIELGLLKDKNVQTELIDSLMKKGMTREQATAQVRPYSAGRDFVDKVKAVGLTSLFAGFYGGLSGLGLTGGNPIGGAVGAAAGAVAGAGVGVGTQSQERNRALNVARVSYGDKNNVSINRNLEKELIAKGYNAMKDYNDRRAFGKNAEQAIIVFNSNKNLKNTNISEVKSTDYGKAYARNYLKEHPNSKLSFNDLVKDGEAEYKRMYESGVIDREREKENKRLLKKATAGN